ncbi:LLM class flavin-dependent oxidoreductase [Puniceibacterium sp. IMCC21224]|uniref:LLM class flavin-dependent oxidoreductase n=1 Tax=Puniceibacterium sp. IMCC21224 TaxID=1618204 RepID=UPI00064DE297|nr:LLM class flavin-dependent oxidoreductase [Puniceibacterium sp. IMCC21224]KMK68795.1 luciferase family oxidoreductase, group 1 [Puniceibacterium sp. IMCC21224]
MKYSVLDLAPVPEGADAATALRNTGELARHAEALGYHRYWLAEHHNMKGIASAATAVLIGHVAGLTQRIRVGAGGIMLPNHAPLAVAEQFGTLATLYPGRIDLGLGRAPGGDMAVMRALRLRQDAGDRFPDDVAELMGYFGPEMPGAVVSAHPGQGTNVPLWMLGSSLYGAQVAAHFGLPYAFASHFAPAALEQAAEIYRQKFQPSDHLQKPHFMLAVNVFAADTDAKGVRLRSSMQQAFYRLRTGQPGQLPRPVDRIEDVIPAANLGAVNEALRITAVGSPATVRRQLTELIARHQPDEVILTGQIHDHAARMRSFEIAAGAMRNLDTGLVA